MNTSQTKETLIFKKKTKMKKERTREFNFAKTSDVF